MFSVNESSDKIMQEGKCLGIKFDSLKTQFANANSYYKIALSINKMPIPTVNIEWSDKSDFEKESEIFDYEEFLKNYIRMK